MNIAKYGHCLMEIWNLNIPWRQMMKDCSTDHNRLECQNFWIFSLITRANVSWVKQLLLFIGLHSSLKPEPYNHALHLNVVPIWFFSTLSYAMLIEPLRITQALHSFQNISFLRISGNAGRYPVGTTLTHAPCTYQLMTTLYFLQVVGKYTRHEKIFTKGQK